MKRILCPKCENYLSFDETKYSDGQSLVFTCEHCGKQFSIRIGKSIVKVPRKEEEKLNETAIQNEFGSIIVIENVFGYKQVIPLAEGDNIIGRRCVGTVINTPIETGDMSMDRRHCIINVKGNQQGGIPVFTLRDANSLTGTFLMNEILGEKDRIRIDDGAIITIGATTLILRVPER
ncbi:MAG: FHA domain-containing protein [Bacteroides sp.]|nr:FHA domain-containing protein [Bacteroides sp.]